MTLCKLDTPKFLKPCGSHQGTIICQHIKVVTEKLNSQTCQLPHNSMIN